MRPSTFSEAEHWYRATLQSLDSNTENTKPQGNFLHVYKTVFHGFSAKLTRQQATQLSNKPGVIAVLPDRLRQLHTTRSPSFLGLYSNNNNNNIKAGPLLAESDSGSDVIIGILDSGIWPERRSFHDEGLGPIPSHWKGECMDGDSFTCNNKIIGARFFADGYQSSLAEIDPREEFMSARDSIGHGTHTASTAAGRAVANASLFGYADGTAVGIAPKARIAAYKVCWKYGCMDSDILAAFDKAVEDGVDIISISVGGGDVPSYFDPIAIGAFGAMERGVSVIASAGNDGPTQRTVENIAPWVTTIGASTIDRRFPADFVLEDGRVIKGVSLYSGQPLPKDTYLPLIYGEACKDDSLDQNLVRGKIVVCDLRGGTTRAAKGEVVGKAGASAVVLANVEPVGEGLVANTHLIPGLAVTASAGRIIRDYINSSRDPRATMIFRGTEVGITPAPVVASFSARGPNFMSPYVLKPDLIAPGANILAAWPDVVSPTGLSSDPRRIEFNMLSGTSVSCPHVSGVAALLKGAHPDWSPAMIRSAMMTTAYTQDITGKSILDEKDNTEAIVWGMGAGHVNPNKALDPGLVYDITADDYLNFLCASDYSVEEISQITRSQSTSCNNVLLPHAWDLNYPAISIDFRDSAKIDLEIMVNRTVTHVGESSANYNVTVINPKGVNVTVNPVTMEFNRKGQNQSYNMRIKAQNMTLLPGNIVTEVGKIVWSDGLHEVVSPVVVMWKQEFCPGC